MFRSFEDYLNRTADINSVNLATAALTDSLTELGLDKICLCISPKKGDSSKNNIGVINNFPKDWEEYYASKKYHLIDPGVAYRQHTCEPFSWDEIERNMHLSDKQKDCINCAREADLHNGVCIPLFGPDGSAHIGLASSHKEAINMKQIDLISAYCHHYYQSYYKLTSTSKQTHFENIALTPKQTDILSLIATGKTDGEVADALLISTNTVDTHMRNIFKKIGINNRVGAVTKAIMLGLINP